MVSDCPSLLSINSNQVPVDDYYPFRLKFLKGRSLAYTCPEFLDTTHSMSLSSFKIKLDRKGFIIISDDIKLRRKILLMSAI